MSNKFSKVSHFNPRLTWRKSNNPDLPESEVAEK